MAAAVEQVEQQRLALMWAGGESSRITSACSAAIFGAPALGDIVRAGVRDRVEELPGGPRLQTASVSSSTSMHAAVYTTSAWKELKHGTAPRTASATDVAVEERAADEVDHLLAARRDHDVVVSASEPSAAITSTMHRRVPSGRTGAPRRWSPRPRDINQASSAGTSMCRRP